jgi:hypothetical protein
MSVLVLTFFLSQTTVLAADLEILGVHMGMPRAELLETLKKSEIATSEMEQKKITASRLPVSLDGVREVRLSFEKDRLCKVVILFEIPPYESTAKTLIDKYETEEERLKHLFGPPADDRAELKPPREEERYQWLIRGRGYYRTMWKVHETQVTLWLYAEDDGLVFQEIYESQ